MAKKAKQASGKPRTRRKIPRPSTVVAEFDLKAPDGRIYRVRRTTQRDEYDEPASGRKPT